MTFMNACCHLGTIGSRIIETDTALSVHATLQEHSNKEMKSGWSGHLSHCEDFSPHSDFTATTVLGLVGGATRVALLFQGPTASCPPQAVAKQWWPMITWTIQAEPRCDDGGMENGLVQR